MSSQPSSSSSTRATAVKLIQAAALAAALVPLGSIQSEAASITCEVGGSGTPVSPCGTDSGYTTFDFGDYKVGVWFFGVTQTFDLTVTDTTVSQVVFDSLVSPSLGTYDCVTLVDPTSGDPGCRSFNFVAKDPTTGEPLADPVWDNYITFFSWLFDTEPTFPNGTSSLGQVRVLQAPDDSTLFTVDMCLAALADIPNYPICTYSSSFLDPTIRSGDTRFSDQIVAWTNTSVPEPASIALLGTGLVGLLYRKRRLIRH